MYSLLLVIIYLAFISLGLPDSLLGSAWPVMSTELAVPVSYAGVISMIISAGTVVSGLSSDRLTRKFGAGWVTAVSVFLTAAALFGFSVSDSFWLLCVLAVPYGLGAGAIDAALNNYVALHYASRHMSWLHCFWGIGTMVSPYIMGACLTRGIGWHSGYRIVSFLQIGLTIILFLSLPLWKKRKTQAHGEEAEDSGRALRIRDAVRIPGVKLVLIVFFSYCAMEATTGLWASSYLVSWRHVGAETAARFASLFYMGITFGRFVSGFISERLGDRRLIRLGGGIMLLGIAMVALPTASSVPALAGLVVIGLGCAPVYPSIIHATPANFGKENSQAIIGIQMACAYVGTTFMPPLFGLIAQHINIALYPAYLLIFAVSMLVLSERMNRRLDKAAAVKKA